MYENGFAIWLIIVFHFPRRQGKTHRQVTRCQLQHLRIELSRRVPWLNELEDLRCLVWKMDIFFITIQ